MSIFSEKWRSTVKTSTGYVAVDTCFTLDHGWETMVFECNEHGGIKSWMDLDCENYKTKAEAKAGHKAMMEKWNGK